MQYMMYHSLWGWGMPSKNNHTPSCVVHYLRGFPFFGGRFFPVNGGGLWLRVVDVDVVDVLLFLLLYDDESGRPWRNSRAVRSEKGRTCPAPPETWVVNCRQEILPFVLDSSSCNSFKRKGPRCNSFWDSCSARALVCGEAFRHNSSSSSARIPGCS